MNRNEDIIKLLDEKKAENVELINIKGSEYFVDEVIIATMISTKQSFAIIEDIKELLKKHNSKVYYEECTDDWSVLDLGDCLIHLMSPAYRDRYQIEKFLLEFKR
ncbi:MULTISPECIES: ribosome silencing factor [unclassified Campylobacter]|uniref:ribosome silencing factor n=1 Tax=unclassified Campylobacter TaxID=2593542 RepID=UPI001BD99EDC|nr:MULTISPECIES: ribosome silencing factor [unclassified Campylobacter]MBZ7976054.1 ribosome silencing factor [Campylobacter sp. RM12637]MBZ7977886.1 ribosome silencing factor [Campylobacter sp. RM12654]MBZ7979855.1 ribosome silencing factor [Campylobacter sp. RM12642]MBZ7982036.1 ribosome silencing factor [Campylobacter sp. RM12640]MBZ7983503.1 ribosome silencing factor [Campylobacter sp. RM12647]MBZ7988908.1 ribosome silencing factor [Campylobacter sp. RM12635]MBZ7991048.1 ribosome silenci